MNEVEAGVATAARLPVHLAGMPWLVTLDPPTNVKITCLLCLDNACSVLPADHDDTCPRQTAPLLPIPRLPASDRCTLTPTHPHAHRPAHSPRQTVADPGGSIAAVHVFDSVASTSHGCTANTQWRHPGTMIFL